MGLGVARAIANAGKTGQIKVISVDGIKDALEAVKTGGIDAVVAQYPYVIGAMGVEACQAAMAGKSLPANVNAPGAAGHQGQCRRRAVGGAQARRAL